MTSVLPEEEEGANVTRLKLKSHAAQSSGASKHHRGDESRSFLSFSRENLSISTLELEQGFSKASTRLRCCSRQSLLSCAAILLALGCLGLELWKLRRAVENARDIEVLKRDVETLKHRFLEKDLLDELRAFEEQLYSEDASEEEDLSSSNSDYDSSYDDSLALSSTTVTSTSEPKSGVPSTSKSSSSSSSPTSTVTPCTSKDLEEVLAVLRRAEAERGQAFEQKVRDHRKRDVDATASGQTWRDKTFFTRLKHPSDN